MPKEMLAPNQRVTLHSLKSSPSLNGKIGTIVGAILESGRYPVQCGKERLALWPANLSLLEEPPAATILPELKLEPRWSPPASHGWKKAITPKPFDNELHALLEMKVGDYIEEIQEVCDTCRICRSWARPDRVGRAPRRGRPDQD